MKQARRGRWPGTIPRASGAAVLSAWLGSGIWAQERPSDLIAGEIFRLGGRTAKIRTLDAPPYVESEYAKRFQFGVYGPISMVETRCWTGNLAQGIVNGWKP